MTTTYHSNTGSNEVENMVISIPVQVSVSPRKETVRKNAHPPNTTNNGSMQAGEHPPHVENDKPFKCSFCDKAYPIKGSLNKHVRLKHGGLKEAHSSLPSKAVEPHHDLDNLRLNGKIAGYQCGSCDTLLNSLEAYKDHLLRHSSKSRFSCTLCSKTFPSASKLWVHQRKRHTQYRRRTHHTSQATYLFPCNVCHRAYNTSSERDKHVKIAHGPCPVCGRVLSSKLCYKDHMNIHLGRRPYKCPKCSLKFYSRKSLGRHKCHRSGKRVKREQVTTTVSEGDGSPLAQSTTSLKADQMLVQPVVVPYDNSQGQGFKCVLCGKVLGRLDAFKSHMNLHTGARPYTCRYCDATFSRNGARWKHMVDVHQTRHTSDLQTAKKPRTLANTRHGLQQSDGKAKQDILTIPVKTMSGQQETTRPSKEDLNVMFSTSSRPEVAGSTITSPTLGPSFSCGVCGVTMQRYASYMSHMAQHTTGTPSQVPSGTSGVAMWDKKRLRRSSVKSPRGTAGKVSSHKVRGKRDTCTLCGGEYSNLKRHMYVAHPLPKSFRMQLRRPGQTSGAKQDPLSLPQSVDMGQQQACEVQCSSESGRTLPALDNSVVDGRVSAHNVLPVCGEVQANEEDQSCSSDSHSDTILVKYGSWNVFFFGDNSTIS